MLVLSDIKERDASENEVVPPVVEEAAVVEDAAVAMEEEVVAENNIERPIIQLEQRIRVLKNNSHCPKCHLICKDLSGSKYKLLTGHTESTKGWGHPNCGTEGAVTKVETAAREKCCFKRKKKPEKK